MRWLYSLCFYLLLPAVLLRLLWRARKAPDYARRWGERFGFFAPPSLAPSVIWLHAVSVGESIAAVPLVRELQQRYPDADLVLTATTPTGSAQQRRLLGDSFVERVFHVYAPYDLPDCVARFLRRVRPDCLIIMETELWPNTVAQCRKRNIPVILANGRLSAKSAAGYGRVKMLMQPVFGGLRAAAVQHADDGRRMEELGLSRERCHVTGNIKFDLTLSEQQRRDAAALRERLRGDSGRPVWVAASTHRGEDEIILEAFARARQGIERACLVLVPRHPERFDEVAALCAGRGFGVARRASGPPPDAGTDVLLGDTMGELTTLYGVGDLAFVGGSLVPVGGHNLIEAAAWGLPVLSGPHLFNFSEAARLLEQAGGLRVVRDGASLAVAFEALSADAARRQVGDAALAVAESNRGALTRLLAVIDRVYGEGAGTSSASSSH